MVEGVFTADQLTDSQRKAVYHVDGALLVIAGPGSGKTRVITSRIAALIDSGVRPYHICAITFTNKAADEMRDRLIAGGVPAGVRASTFHSLCVRILRQYAEQSGVGSNFSIYDAGDQKRCVKDALKACEVDSTSFTPMKMLGAISQFKNDLEDVEAVSERADDYVMKITARVYAGYQKILAKNNALDFDDLLVKTAFLLRDFPDVRAELSNRFRYLLVDEYQDTNHAQYQIAKGLALAHGNICVTGDPDQSIYKWRGADIENILEFEGDWPNAVVVKLEENFRSTPNILEAADKLIAINTKRKSKRLVATLPRGEDIVAAAFADDDEEAEEVATAVRGLIDEGVDLNEIAVFYRVNSMSRLLEEAFVAEQIPYQVVRGVEFYSRKEIRDMISYLKLIANPADDVAFLRAVGTHSRGIGKTTIVRVSGYAAGGGLSLYEASRQAARIETISQGVQGKLATFVNMIEEFKKGADGAVAPLMESIFEETGLQTVMLTAGDKQASAIENINELINAAAKYDKQTEEPSLVDYLQGIALYSDTDAYDPAAGRVSLMTLHAAKGLEFDNVFIVGVEDGILPHERSLAEGLDFLEEERRLLFVGMTRAKRRLNMSYAKHRTLRGQYLRTTPSQFLYEMGYGPSEYEYDTEFAQDSLAGSFADEEQRLAVPQKRAGVRAESLAPGVLVDHGKFGIGVVKEFLDLGDNSIVVVRFDSGKTKSLMMKYAKLRKISG